MHDTHCTYMVVVVLLVLVSCCPVNVNLTCCPLNVNLNRNKCLVRMCKCPVVDMLFPIKRNYKGRLVNYITNSYMYIANG